MCCLGDVPLTCALCVFLTEKGRGGSPDPGGTRTPSGAGESTFLLVFISHYPSFTHRPSFFHQSSLLKKLVMSADANRVHMLVL